MPVIAPFRALCYAPGLRADLDRLIAPPYDVQSETEREALAARHARSIVHLDLPRAGPDGDPYAVSAALLSAFVREGTLQRDPQAAFYVLEQRFRVPPGEPRIRRGFFARLSLEAFEAGVVLPHERTMDRPRTDRRRLLAATRTHLSAVFLLHPDPEAVVARLLERVADGRAFAEARDGEGVACRVVRMNEAGDVDTLVEKLSGAWALIADGHHRYESALAYREERRAAGRADAETILAFFCSLEDRGLSILPIHRLVRSLASFDPTRFKDRLAECFALTRVATDEALRAALAERRGRAGVFGMTLRGEAGFMLLEWRDGAGLERPEIASIPEPLRRLDVVLLHHLVLQGILGITTEDQARQTHLDYVKDDREVFERVGAGRDQIGFVLNATRIEQVVDVTRRGLRLPQKTTYFYPKIPTGLVLDPLDS